MSATERDIEWENRHIELLLSGDVETLLDELFQMAYLVAARRIMPEEQAKQVRSMAHDLVRAKMRHLIELAADGAKDESGRDR